jgi:hypothetical protein
MLALILARIKEAAIRASVFPGRVSQQKTVANGTEEERQISRRNVWKLPSYTHQLSEREKRIHARCNKFLKSQQSRIRKHIAREEYMYAARIGLMLMQRSRVFTVFVLSKTSKGYFYKLPEFQL